MWRGWWGRHRPGGAVRRREQGRRSRVVGRRGERVARRALRRAGYRILARNVRTPHGEVDVVAVERGVLVVVEVKTTARSGVEAAPPPVEPGQARRLRRAARWLARRAGPARRIRLDLVCVRLAPPGPRVVIRRGGF